MTTKKKSPSPPLGHVTLMTFETREMWLRGRQRYVGSSDAPGVLGVSRYRSTPLKVWLSKTQPIAPEKLSELPEWLEWGHRHEPTIAQAFAEKKNREVLMPSALYGAGNAKHHFAIDSEFPFLAGSCDRFQRKAGEKTLGILEIKTDMIGGDWKNGPPIDYQVQVQHQLRVTGLTWASIAVLVHGSHFETWDVERNDRFIERMVAIERRFWQYVVDGTPPGPTALDSEALKRLFPKEEDGLVVALVSAEFVGPDGKKAILNPYEVMRRRAGLKKLADNVEAEVDACDVVLKSMLGNASRGLLPDGSYAAWETQGGFDVAARHQESFRKFRCHIPKALVPEIAAITDLSRLPALLPSGELEVK